jgi:hypothetical protein
VYSPRLGVLGVVAVARRERPLKLSALDVALQVAFLKGKL